MTNSLNSNEKTENLSEEIEITKMNQMEIIKLKIIESKIKYWLDGLSSRDDRG